MLFFKMDPIVFVEFTVYSFTMSAGSFILHEDIKTAIKLLTKGRSAADATRFISLRYYWLSDYMYTKNSRRQNYSIFPPRIFERILLTGFLCEDVPLHRALYVPIIPVPVPVPLWLTRDSHRERKK